jgi:hypothetical protein
MTNLDIFMKNKKKIIIMDIIKNIKEKIIDIILLINKCK